MRVADGACERACDEAKAKAGVKMADGREKTKTEKAISVRSAGECGYVGCSFFGRLRSLDRHQNRRHPNPPKRIANSAFREEGCWASWRVSEASLQGEPLPYLTIISILTNTSFIYLHIGIRGKVIFYVPKK